MFSQAKRITDFLLQMLDSNDSPEVQAVLCTGICKLLLAGIITDHRVGFLPAAPDLSKLIF
jgi:condensin complex subunit 3